MKQLHVAIDGLLIRKGVSGVETAIYDLAQAAGAYGSHRYSFFLRQQSPLPDVHGGKTSTIRCRIPFSWRVSRLVYQYILLPGRARQLACDVLHFPGYLAPGRSKTPVVVTIHDLLAFSHPEFCRQATVLHYRFQLPRSVKYADAIVVPSEYTCHVLADHFPEAMEKTHVVPFGVDERFHPQESCDEKVRLSTRYNLPDSFILFVGQIEPKKNVPGLLRAFKMLIERGVTSHHLVIAGSQGWEPVNIKALAGELNIVDYVHLLGFVPQADLPGLYRAADIFAFPSFCEGFGLPPLEAMACGTPVILSNQGSLPEIAGPATGMCSPEESHAWAYELEKMIGDRDLRRLVADKGLNRAAQFTWKTHMKKMDAIYRDVARCRK